MRGYSTVSAAEGCCGQIAVVAQLFGELFKAERSSSPALAAPIA